MTTEQDKFLESIARTTADYRAGELPSPTAAHGERWIKQFDASVRVPLLRELDHVLKKTYFSRAFVSKFFSEQIGNEKLAWGHPALFWRSANVLNIQKHGGSQSDIRLLFAEALQTQGGIKIDECGIFCGPYIYLDDVLFSGGRISDDLTAWLAHDAPAKGRVVILVIASHELGEWQCMEGLKKTARTVGKDITFDCWAAVRFENRLKYKDISEVLWPARLPDEADLKTYLAEEVKFPFEPRNPGGRLRHNVFTSEEGRQLLERELLLAGMRIRSFCENPNRSMRPLGYSTFGLGFGSMIVTFRNCPNNCPLALWWGDSDADPSHPFSKWYPLFPRKTYVIEAC